ncbi:MAG: hypothetical protein ACOY4D_05705 [Pseudomonadota bacterium]
MNERALDPLVAPLVRAMNERGLFMTLASCQGHRLRGMAPYVYFRAPIETVQALCRVLREDGARSHPRLHYGWEVEGRLNMEYQLCWSLTVPALETYCLWRQRKLADDLGTLRSMIEELRLDLGEKAKVTIKQQDDGQQGGNHIADELVEAMPHPVRATDPASRASICVSADGDTALPARNERHDFPSLEASQW